MTVRKAVSLVLPGIGEGRINLAVELAVFVSLAGIVAEIVDLAVQMYE